MAELMSPTIGELTTPLGYDGTDFRPLLADSAGKLVALAGSDGTDVHMLKTDSSGKLLCTISGLPTDADTVDGEHATDFVHVAGDTMTGDLVLNADPSAALGAATKQTVDAKVAKSGDTMTGLLVLSADPAAALGAATKQYVDAKVSKSGDTMTGLLVLSADPAADLGAATKQYVDAHAVSPGTLLKKVWDPRAPAASPSAYDDEFDDASINAALWTHWDVGTVMTPSETAQGMQCLHSASGADSFAGEIQAVVDQQISVYTHLSQLSAIVNYNTSGLIIGSDLIANPATAAFVIYGLQFGAGGIYLVANRYTRYNLYGASLMTGLLMNACTDIWLRLRIALGVGNIAFDYSSDGISWIQYGLVSKPWVFKELGVGGCASGAAWNTLGCYAFFRTISSTISPYAIMPANTVNLWG